MKKLIVLVFIGAMIANAEAKTITVKGSLKAKNPCSGELVTVHGITFLAIEKTVTGVIVYEDFKGSENGYSVTFHGENEFNELKNVYEIQTIGHWNNGKNLFKSIAIDRIFAKNGIIPTGDKFQNLNNVCEKNESAITPVLFR